MRNKNSPQVRIIYDPILRQPTKPVTVFDAELKKLSEKMLEIMHQHIGMGLAANQLGIDKNLFVIEVRPPKGEKELKPIAPFALCNAKISKISKETSTMIEGCLSLPGLELPVTRPSGVTVEAQDLTGKQLTIKAKGLLARILQHEIDHLDGILFTDRADGVKNIKNYAESSIVFFGSDEFSAIILENLTQSGLNVMAVITETDKRAGRGDTIVAPLVKTLAQQKHIAVVQPESKAEIIDALDQLKPDLVVLASYGKILPAEALELPTYGCLNVHPSLLPKYRGATPLQSAILSGDNETGVTIMKMNAGVDTGEIVAQTSATITVDETFLTLRDKLARAGADLLLKTIPAYLSGQVKIRVQSGNFTQTTKLTKKMGEIDWAAPAEIIDRQIRALNPWPGTFTFVGDKRLKILEAKLVGGELSLVSVQLEGKNPTAWPEFVRGYAQQLKNCPWYSKIA